MAEPIDPFAGVGPDKALEEPPPRQAAPDAARADVDPFAGVVPDRQRRQVIQEEAAKTRPPGRWQEPKPVRDAVAQRRPAPPPTDMLSREGAADIAKAAGSGLAMGVLADIPGIIGSTGQLYDIASQKLANLTARGKEAFGFAPAGSAERAIKLAQQQAQQGKTEAELAGDVNRVFGVSFPTAQGMEKTIRNIAPELSYAPETRAGKLVSSTLRAVPSGVFGGGTGLLTRVGMAGTSGFLSEAAGQAAEGTQYEAAARLAGSFLGPLGYNSMKNATMVLTGPGKSQTEKLLLDAIAKDIANGSSKMTPQQLQAAIDSGASPGLWNMGGAETRRLVEKLGYATPAAQDALENLNQRILQQSDASRDAMRDHIASTFNVTTDAFDIQQAIKNANQNEIRRLYTALQTDPAARAVSSPNLNSFLQDVTFQKVAQNARDLATSSRSGIIAPSAATPGNIFFWDQVKRDLDDQINAAFRNGENNRGMMLRDLRKDMLSELDNAVPSYRQARDKAAESLGAQNAVEAGYNAVRGAPDAFKVGNALNAFKSYTPDRKEMFRQGLASQLAELSQQGGPEAILKILENPNKAKLVKGVLNPQEIDSIVGRATAESVMNRTKAYAASFEDPNVQKQFVKAQVIYDMGPAMLSAARGDFSPMINILSTYAVTGTTGLFANKAMRKQAEQVMKLIGTNDPKQLEKLGEIIRKSPATQSFLGNMLDAMRNIAVRGTIGTPVSQQVTAPTEQPEGQGAAGSDDVFQRMLGVESGNRQVNERGETILGPEVNTEFGRHRAVGAAQVMPYTGPEAAAAAGLEWDPNRFRTDMDYNVALGRAYYEKQLQAFGDPRKAAAAYNAGPRRLREAMQKARERGGSFEDYLPAETQDYLRKVFGAASGGRIERRAGGRVDSVDGLVDELMNRVRKAKRETQKITEPLLDQPDEHIVKALDVAQQAI
jgi:hypothetical protein